MTRTRSQAVREKWPIGKKAISKTNLKIKTRSLTRQKRNETENLTARLTDLPDEILEKIFNYVNIWHHNRIRSTCRQLLYVHDDYIVHRFRVMHQHALRVPAEQPDNYENAVIKTLFLATDNYLLCEYQGVFASSFLPLMRQCYNGPFEPSMANVSKCLKSFYVSVEELEINAKHFPQSLLFTLTFFRLLLALEENSTESLTVQNHVSLQISANFAGKTVGSIGKSPGRITQRHNDLLVILHELLFYDKMAMSKKRIWDTNEAVYVVGHLLHPIRGSLGCNLKVTLCANTATLNVFERMLDYQIDFSQLEFDCLMQPFQIQIYLQNIGSKDRIDFSPPCSSYVAV